MVTKVVLDALIPRQDFDLKDESGVAVTRNVLTMSVNDLDYNSFMYSAIKKPDFQRETNEWTPEKIHQLILSFVDGELIPSVILWKSMSNHIFAIDGSHRISALAAWVNDDYGDGSISREFFDNDIPKEQLKAAERTRVLINENIGSYQELKSITRNPIEDEEKNKRAKNLGSLAIQLQWVEGNSSSAEESFFRINQQGTPISPTEIKLIKSRNLPNGLAARAIVRSGKGHNYWSKFPKDVQDEIYKIAKEINEILFLPEYKTPIKTLNLPIGGPLLSDQGQQLILETINIANGLKENEELSKDETGEITIRYLKECRKIVRRINSIHPSSLGLHPVVYFYNLRGMHKIASYYAILGFIKYLDQNNSFNKFIEIRENFEDIMIYYEYLVQSIVRRYRQSTKGHKFITQYYIQIVENLSNGYSIEETMTNIVNSKEFSYLSKEVMTKEEVLSDRFSDGRKSSVFIVEALKNATKCAICKGYLHMNSITIDHKIRKQDGGTGEVENGQLAHPYCNSSYKN
ncbi:HNH endonuclease family protein [Lysinibacillus sp. NPDC056220]|uniref:HNH endonuclease family protein n=1 Tax=Lysinibacillus sp. NPDC056220 TaxID=3398580 RepID=UPI003BF5E196